MVQTFSTVKVQKEYILYLCISAFLCECVKFGMFFDTRLCTGKLWENIETNDSGKKVMSKAKECDMGRGSALSLISILCGIITMSLIIGNIFLEPNNTEETEFGYDDVSLPSYLQSIGESLESKDSKYSKVSSKASVVSKYSSSSLSKGSSSFSIQSSVETNKMETGGEAKSFRFMPISRSSSKSSSFTRSTSLSINSSDSRNNQMEPIVEAKPYRDSLSRSSSANSKRSSSHVNNASDNQQRNNQMEPINPDRDKISSSSSNSKESSSFSKQYSDSHRENEQMGPIVEVSPYMDTGSISQSSSSKESFSFSKKSSDNERGNILSSSSFGSKTFFFVFNEIF